MARSATQPQGAEEIAGAIQRDQHGQILDNLEGYLQGNQEGRAANGAGILGHVLGPRQQPVQQGIGQAAGLEPRVVEKLLQLLAPIVMGALSRSARQQQGEGSPAVNPGAVQDVLTRAQDGVRQQAPQGFDLINRLLDANHDGSALDDLARMGQGLLGGLLGGRK